MAPAVVRPQSGGLSFSSALLQECTPPGTPTRTAPGDNTSTAASSPALGVTREERSRAPHKSEAVDSVEPKRGRSPFAGHLAEPAAATAPLPIAHGDRINLRSKSPRGPAFSSRSPVLPHDEAQFPTVPLGQSILELREEVLRLLQESEQRVAQSHEKLTVSVHKALVATETHLEAELKAATSAEVLGDTLAKAGQAVGPSTQQASTWLNILEVREEIERAVPGHVRAAMDASYERLVRYVREEMDQRLQQIRDDRDTGRPDLHLQLREISGGITAEQEARCAGMSQLREDMMGELQGIEDLRSKVQDLQKAVQTTESRLSVSVDGVVFRIQDLTRQLEAEQEHRCQGASELRNDLMRELGDTETRMTAKVQSLQVEPKPLGSAYEPRDAREEPRERDSRMARAIHELALSCEQLGTDLQTGLQAEREARAKSTADLHAEVMGALDKCLACLPGVLAAPGAPASLGSGAWAGNTDGGSATALHGMAQAFHVPLRCAVGAVQPSSLPVPAVPSRGTPSQDGNISRTRSPSANTAGGDPAGGGKSNRVAPGRSPCPADRSGVQQPQLDRQQPSGDGLVRAGVSPVMPPSRSPVPSRQQPAPHAGAAVQAVVVRGAPSPRRHRTPPPVSVDPRRITST